MGKKTEKPEKEMPFTPEPPQVMDPSKPPKKQGEETKKKGTIKKKR